MKINHLAIIMDGNRRWAVSNNLPSYQGHQKGAENLWNIINDIDNSDIILVGVSRTSKTPTSIYLANRGFKTSNIPLVNKNSIPSKVMEKNFMPCVVGLVTEAERLYDLRKNRLTSLKEDQNSEYVNIDKIRDELDSARRIFKENNWPIIDVTRKSVEETAASVIKIYEIKSKKNA